MDIGKHAYSLVTALVLGAMIVGLTAEPAAAEEKKTSKDDGTRCSLQGGDLMTPSENDYEFYMPGASEWVTLPNGNVRVLECQADGTWQDVSTSRPGRVPPGNVPGHTFGQAP